ncbi:hypothetical protein HDV01_005743 [Terramyces sp. JEL0728]|nr:hypothetical protein HDV01_005743 [Terramyces sp. JEL0728]
MESAAYVTRTPACDLQESPFVKNIMGRLVLFNRSMLFGSDDCVLLGITKLILDLIVVIATVNLTFQYPSTCSPNKYYYLIIENILLFIDIIIDFMIFWTSLQGTVAYSTPRKHMPKFLYMSISMIFMQSSNQIFGLFSIGESGECSDSTFFWFWITILYLILLGTIVHFVIYVLAFIASHPYIVDQRDREAHMARAITPLFFGTAYLNRDAHISPKEILEDVAQILTEIFGTDSLCVSDVVVGLILVRKRLQMNGVAEHTLSTADEYLANTRIGNAQYSDRDPIIFNLKAITRVSLYVEAIYGIPLYMFANLRRGCTFMCCPHLNAEIASPIIAIERTMDTGCQSLLCCFPGTWIPDTTHPDLVYKSIKGKLFKSPFAVSVDHALRSVIISIRGTLSTTDLLVDLYIKEQEIMWTENNETKTAVTHQGMYVIANTILNELEAGGVFSKIKETFPDYSLICSGHSLGAGVASLLAFLLRTKPSYGFADSASAICYSTPGAIISAEAIPFFQTFCTSVVFGDDFVARLNQKNVYNIKNNIIGELSVCHQRKVDVLSNALINQVFRNRRRRVSQEQLQDIPAFPPYHGTSMYLPGNVLYLVRNEMTSSYSSRNSLLSVEDNESGYSQHWVDPFALSTDIPISKNMVMDHLPNIVGNVLRSLNP